MLLYLIGPLSGLLLKPPQRGLLLLLLPPLCLLLLGYPLQPCDLYRLILLILLEGSLSGRFLFPFLSSRGLIICELLQASDLCLLGFLLKLLLGPRFFLLLLFPGSLLLLSDLLLSFNLCLPGLFLLLLLLSGCSSSLFLLLSLQSGLLLLPELPRGHLLGCQLLQALDLRPLSLLLKAIGLLLSLEPEDLLLSRKSLKSSDLRLESLILTLLFCLHLLLLNPESLLFRLLFSFFLLGLFLALKLLVLLANLDLHLKLLLHDLSGGALVYAVKLSLGTIEVSIQEQSSRASQGILVLLRFLKILLGGV